MKWTEQELSTMQTDAHKAFQVEVEAFKDHLLTEHRGCIWLDEIVTGEPGGSWITDVGRLTQTVLNWASTYRAHWTNTYDERGNRMWKRGIGKATTIQWKNQWFPGVHAWVHVATITLGGMHIFCLKPNEEQSRWESY